MPHTHVTVFYSTSSVDNFGMEVCSVEVCRVDVCSVEVCSVEVCSVGFENCICFNVISYLSRMQSSWHTRWPVSRVLSTSVGAEVLLHRKHNNNNI